MTAVDEPQTLYVLPDDVLVLPVREQHPAAVARAVEDLQGHFGLHELVISDGVDRPWILRKAHTVPPAPGQDA